MKPSDQIERINQLLNVVGDTKGNSIVNYDALHAVRKILGRDDSRWVFIGDDTLLKRTLRKNLVVI